MTGSRCSTTRCADCPIGTPACGLWRTGAASCSTRPSKPCSTRWQSSRPRSPRISRKPSWAAPTCAAACRSWLSSPCFSWTTAAGIAGTNRLNGLARRALRTLFAERPGDVSLRIAALAAALPGFGQADPDTSLADTATLITHPDPYVQAMGYFIRAVLGENGGTRHSALGDGELAYRRFEAIGDHWGMGMAAH